MTITAETMAASKAEPKPRAPTDYKGNSIHVGGIYTREMSGERPL